MKPKHLAYLALFTLGAIPLLMWSWRCATKIDLGSVSEAWLVNQDVNPTDPYTY